MTRFTRWIVIACMGAVAACSSGDGGNVGVTELNVVVPTNAGTPDAIDIQVVQYRIDCEGNDELFLDNNDSFDDGVFLTGDLEVVDGRTSGSPAVPTEIWQGFMDLPPGPCDVELTAVDNDGEVICMANDSFDVDADYTTKVNLVLLCQTSFQAPVGMLDLDATFSFVVGNFCPDLFVLNCLDSEPQAVDVGIGTDIARSECQVRFRDGDSTCDQRCDPQSCDDSVIPTVCTPGPDPGVSTTITCAGPDGVVDCDGDFIGDTSCTFSGDQTTTGTWFAACLPPDFGGTPGAVITCTAVTTDGDIDCDKTKQVSITCPGLNFCDEPSTDCDDLNDCTNDSCDPGASACVNDPEPLGTSCSDFLPQAGECDGEGMCLAQGCSDNSTCAEPTDCTGQGQCVDFACEAPPNINEGLPCDSGTGICVSGSCVVAVCGDGVTEGTEECDDGNTDSFDGCSSICTIEQCQNPDDFAAIGANDPTDLATACGTACIADLTSNNQPAYEACLQTCIENAGYSVGCAGCLVDQTSCASFNCVLPDLTGPCSPFGTGTPEECDQCQEDNGCAGLFSQCGGIPPPPPSIDYPEITQDIPSACFVSFNGALADFPVQITIDPSPISANAPFTAVITPAAVVTEEFIQAALEVIPTLSTVDVTATVATLGVVENGTGADVQSALSPVPQTFNLLDDTNGNTIPGPLVVVLSTETGNYTAGASGTEVAFDVVGTITAPSATQVDAIVLGAIPLVLSCEPGTANDNGTPENDSDDFVNPQDPAARIRFLIP